jgi:hypothetical protein
MKTIIETNKYLVIFIQINIDVQSNNIKRKYLELRTIVLLIKTIKFQSISRIHGIKKIDIKTSMK